MDQAEQQLDEPPQKKARCGELPPAPSDIAPSKPAFFTHDARKLLEVVSPRSVQLVVTSPPYPMIAMWDSVFQQMDPSIPADPTQWTRDDAMIIFEKMHQQLDVVWQQLHEAVSPGGIVAINMGDATRSVDRNFQLFPNGARTTMGMIAAGFTPLPNIYWKKPTNGPNAFLGSGFLPVNAYVTIDCEHILLFRQGTLRKFASEDQQLCRRYSCFTRDERDDWFSQTWTGITGVRQRTPVSGQRRSAAFPEEIPFRLIRMFSIMGDTVLDPFVGTGTTAKAASKLGRNCLGLDIDASFVQLARNTCLLSS